MLLIPCIHCGPRDETEFHYGGEAGVPYPEHPDQLTDAEWAQFLFYRDNPKGPFEERWLHRIGCRQWFNVVRDTSTYEILDVYAVGTSRPDRPMTTVPETDPASTSDTSTTASAAGPDPSGTTDALAHTHQQERTR